MLKLTISGRFPSLNEYICACRSNPHKGANMIRKDEQNIMHQIQAQTDRPLRAPVLIRYTFHEPSRRRDKDNISAYAHKTVQDSIVRAGLLEDDSWNYITGYSDRFAIDKDNPRIELLILEDGEY